DERVLEAAPSAQAVLADASAFRERLNALTALEAAADEAARKARALDRIPAGAIDSPETRAGIERWRDRLGDTRRAVETAELTARQTEARAAQMEQSSAATTAPPRSRLLLPGVIVAIGLVAVVAGALTGQWVAAAMGAAVLIAGGILAFTSTRVAPSPVSVDAERARVDANAAADVAHGATVADQEAREQWRGWLGENSLDVYGDDPVAVLGLLDEVRDRDRLLEEADRLSADARRERDAAEAWVIRLVDVARRIDPSASQVPDLSAALELAGRVRSTVSKAEESAAESSALTAQLTAAENELDRLVRHRASFAQIVDEVAAEHSVAAEHAADVLATRAREAAEELENIRGRCELLADELSGLRGRLDEEGRDDAMALARQELEGLRAAASAAADRYLVHALAVRLVDRARERFERERQPEVVRTAGSVFSAMTGGRYRDLRVPLDDSGITVVAQDGSVRSTGELSRGTAEQLYLALRVGLIGSLGDLGRALPVLMDDVVVNFDPERRQGAVEAVAELARLRQVLFFTCHPETAEVLAGSVSGARLVELDRCSFGS
ncbi:MAG TPA: hypothetical protein VLA05_03500, partial [Coriobacteriia bacterium]|nr:hypothetical protein [Coriobacteriia bacterium]